MTSDIRSETNEVIAASRSRATRSLESKVRVKRLGALTGWFAVVWVAWVLLNGPYLLIRGIGDDLSTPRGVEGIERALFAGMVPTRLLQEQLYARDLAWLDYAAFVAHGFWFGVPFAFGLVLTIYQRQRILEFTVWMTALTYIAAIFFLLLPVRPPWMEPGIERVLMVRNYGDYVDIDNNPAAAFPSLHAALPAMVAMFFFIRCDPKLRFYGWLAVAFTLTVSASIVYMGEHWVIDVVAGYGVAGLTALAFTASLPRRLARSIPGDPVGRLVRFNDSLTLGQAQDPPEAIQPAEPEVARRAA